MRQLLKTVAFFSTMSFFWFRDYIVTVIVTVFYGVNSGCQNIKFAVKKCFNWTPAPNLLLAKNCNCFQSNFTDTTDLNLLFKSAKNARTSSDFVTSYLHVFGSSLSWKIKMFLERSIEVAKTLIAATGT